MRHFVNDSVDTLLSTIPKFAAEINDLALIGRVDKGVRVGRASGRVAVRVHSISQGIVDVIEAVLVVGIVSGRNASKPSGDSSFAGSPVHAVVGLDRPRSSGGDIVLDDCDLVTVAVGITDQSASLLSTDLVFLSGIHHFLIRNEDGGNFFDFCSLEIIVVVLHQINEVVSSSNAELVDLRKINHCGDFVLSREVQKVFRHGRPASSSHHTDVFSNSLVILINYTE